MRHSNSQWKIGAPLGPKEHFNGVYSLNNQADGDPLLQVSHLPQLLATIKKEQRPSKSDPRTKDLEQDVYNLKREIESLKQECTELVDKNNVLNKKNARLMFDYKRLQGDAVGLARVKADWKRETSQKQNVIDTLEGELADTKLVAEKAVDLSVQLQELQALYNKDSDRLQKAVDLQAFQEAEAVEAKQRVLQLEEDNSRIKLSLVDTKKANKILEHHIGKHEKKQQEALAHVSELQAKISSMEADSSGQRNTIKETIAKLAATEKAKAEQQATLQSQLADVTSQLERETSKVVTLSDNLSNLQNAHGQLKEDLSAERVKNQSKVGLEELQNEIESLQEMAMLVVSNQTRAKSIRDTLLTPHTGLSVCSTDGKEGLQVSGISAGSTAAASGIQLGDTLILINSTALFSVPAFQTLINGFKVGQHVAVHLHREEKPMSVVLRIGGVKKGSPDQEFIPNLVFDPLMRLATAEHDDHDIDLAELDGQENTQQKDRSEKEGGAEAGAGNEGGLDDMNASSSSSGSDLRGEDGDNGEAGAEDNVAGVSGNEDTGAAELPSTANGSDSSGFFD